MLALVFEKQSEWVESSGTSAKVIRKFAEELDLDVITFDDAVADVRTRETIEADRAGGMALGVRGTPTFFLLDDEKIEAESLNHFRKLISDASKEK